MTPQHPAARAPDLARTFRHVIAALRIAGLIAVIVIVISLHGRVPIGNAFIFLGVLPLAAFLWLTVSGFFGYGDARRGDWVG